MAARISLFRRLVNFLFLTALLLVVAGSALLWYFGAWNIAFPSTRHDSRAPWVPAEMQSPAVLIFSKTNNYRHVEAIDAGRRALTQIGQGQGWGTFATDNGAIFNERDLQRFDSVVFLNANGDMLSPAQERAFQDWLTTGGGWVGIHAAGDYSHTDWPWYQQNLIGTKFMASTFGPQRQRATIVMASPDHPVVQRLPNVWAVIEEWYSWEESPRSKGFNILAVVDEESYLPKFKIPGYEKDLHMDDHPVVWTNCVGAGRTLYSALGHSAATFDRPEYRILLEDAIRWTMGVDEDGC